MIFKLTFFSVSGNFSDMKITELIFSRDFSKFENKNCTYDELLFVILFKCS